MNSFSKPDLHERLKRWYRAWNDHDIDGVMDLVHDDIVFVNWDGATVIGKKTLHKKWALWFEHHGGFSFSEEETFIDEGEQKVLFRWTLEWRTGAGAHGGSMEKRAGVDVLHFKDNRIIKKLTYSRTDLTINGKRVVLMLQP